MLKGPLQCPLIGEKYNTMPHRLPFMLKNEDTWQTFLTRCVQNGMFPYPWDVFYGSIWETAHRKRSEMGGPFRNSLEGDWMNVLPHLKPVEPCEPTVFFLSSWCNWWHEMRTAAARRAMMHCGVKQRQGQLGGKGVKYLFQPSVPLLQHVC